MAGKFTFQIANNRTGDEKLINLLLTASSPEALTGIEIGKSTTLADFLSTNPNGEFSAEQLLTSRLYFGYGSFPPAPEPQSQQYYGWIEFSRNMTTDNGVWINLSNVDIFALPLTLKGNDTSGRAFSLGYKNPVTDIISQMKTRALTSPSNAAVIDCGGGKTKIVAPNIQFPWLRPFDGYLDSLAGAPLKIYTDTPKTAPQKLFTGSFNSRKFSELGSTDPILSLSSDSDTFSILKSQFTTEYLYRCDGGTVIYQGQTVNQNRDDNSGNNAPVVYTNSLFRNLCIGVNEGYLTAGGPNDSSLFAASQPFQDARGNVYAQVVHENSNSYGFPYSDKNLKTLIVAAIDTPITVTVLKDDQAEDYTG